MQECDACGLLFGGTEECPSCGSRVSHQAPENIDEGGHGRPTGPLPGESALDDAISGIEGLDISLPSDSQSQFLPSESQFFLPPLPLPLPPPGFQSDFQFPVSAPPPLAAGSQWSLFLPSNFQSPPPALPLLKNVDHEVLSREPQAAW